MEPVAEPNPDSGPSPEPDLACEARADASPRPAGLPWRWLGVLLALGLLLGPVLPRLWPRADAELEFARYQLCTALSLGG